MLVRCFCQKLSGLIMYAVCTCAAKFSCNTLRIGFTVVHVDLRMSMITVNVRSRTSSL